MLFRILDPQTKANQFWRDFDRLNDELTRSILDSQFGSSSNFPPVNVYTKEDEALVTCLLPGLEPDQIEINVKDNLLSIHGKKNLKNSPKEPKSYAGRFLMENSTGLWNYRFESIRNMSLQNSPMEF